MWMRYFTNESYKMDGETHILLGEVGKPVEIHKSVFFLCATSTHVKDKHKYIFHGKQ